MLCHCEWGIPQVFITELRVVILKNEALLHNRDQRHRFNAYYWFWGFEYEAFLRFLGWWHRLRLLGCKGKWHNHLSLETKGIFSKTRCKSIGCMSSGNSFQWLQKLCWLLQNTSYVGLGSPCHLSSCNNFRGKWGKIKGTFHGKTTSEGCGRVQNNQKNRWSIWLFSSRCAWQNV